MDKEKKGNGKKIVALALALVLLIGGTYAWLTLTLNGTKTTRIEAGTLAMEIQDESDGISIENAVPITDAEGREQTPYKFVLENTGTVQSEYTVYLDKQGIDAETEFDMPLNRIKCHITKVIKTQVGDTRNVDTDTTESEDTKTVLLSDISDEAGTSATLDTSTGAKPLEANQYIVYEVRLWIDQDAVNSDLQRTQDDKKLSAVYSGKLRIDATQTGIEEDEAYAGQ